MDQSRPKLRANRQFHRLVLAKASNELSGTMCGLAMSLLILGLTHNATMAGIASLCSGATTIVVQTFGGTFVDRHSASGMLKLSSYGQALGWCIVIVGALNIMPLIVSYIVICVGAVIASATSGLDGPSEQALLKRIVAQEDLGHAAAIGQARESAAGLIGGPISGALFGVSPLLPFGVQTVLNLIAGVATPVPPTDKKSKETTHEESFFSSLAQGYALVLRDSGLLGIAILSGIANFSFAALPLALIANFTLDGLPSFQISLFGALSTVGILLGASLAGPLTTRVRLGVLGIVAMVVCLVAEALLIVSYDNFWLTVFLWFLVGIPLPSFNAAIISYTTAHTPENMVGRVTSATGVPGMILMPLGAFVGGLLTQHYSAGLVACVCTIVTGIATCYMVGARSLRTIPLLADLEPLDSTEEQAE